MIGFGKCGRQRELGIVSTEDARLLMIDPTSDGFFANVLEYVAEDEAVRKFIEAVREVQEAKVSKFWIPIYDPSIKGKEVVFKAGNAPAVGHSFNFWKEEAGKMPTVDGKHWSIGSEYQYYAFLVWIVNSKLESGWNVADAIKAVVLDSKELEHYYKYNNWDTWLYFEKTGSREVCGVYDLENTLKLLSCTNEVAGGFWVAGGVHGSFNHPLAELYHFDRDDVDDDYNTCVGWLVLS